jgi:hypothetical protein
MIGVYKTIRIDRYLDLLGFFAGLCSTSNLD